jgi:purine-binding chemotaxis protein CheW
MDAFVESPAAGPAGLLPGGGSGGDDGLQFVVFHVQDEQFAIPLAEVREIIRMPDLVRVPMGPTELEGLANLRGAVLPVISLRDVFRFPTALHDDATRVLVLDCGQTRPAGLVVDRMASVVTVDPGRIEASANTAGTVATDLLAGMIRGEDGRPMVMILDTGRIVHRQFSGIPDRASPSGGPASAVRAPDAPAADAAAADEDHLVSFEVAGQEYAFPIEQVQEIVQLPAHITHVPKAAGHVIGVISLRNQLLPLVGMREMFGLPSAELTEANKVVVVSAGGLSVGVVMDSVKEVLRVSRALVGPVPALLANGGGMGEVKAICRLQDGRRLVSVLSAERMFNVGEIRKASATGGESGPAGDGAPGTPSEREDDGAEEQFVVFRLMDGEYGVPIEAVQEIVRVPEHLTRIPKTPAFVEGVINLRGAVLPVVDQRRRFGMPDAERSDRQRIIVFTAHGVRTGFIVDSVSGVSRIPVRFIGAAPDLPDGHPRLIGRVANIEEQNRIVLLPDICQMLDTREAEAVRAVSG